MVVRSRHIISVMVLFCLGSSIINIGSYGYHTWQALILGFLMCLPTLFLYSYLLKKYPNKNLYVIIDEIFPKIITFIILIIYFIFALFVGSRIIFRYVDFILSAQIIEKYLELVYIVLFILVFYILKQGTNTWLRFSQVGFVIVILAVLFFFVVGIEDITIDYLYPLIPKVSKNFIDTATIDLIEPFLESIFVYNYVCKLNNKKIKPYIYFISLFVSLILLLIIVIRTVGVLGESYSSILNFPFYVSVSIITFMEFIARIEALSVNIFFITAIAKLVVAIYNLDLITKQMFKLEKSIYSSNILLTIVLSRILYRNIAELNASRVLYSYIATSYTIIIPLLLVIITIFKKSSVEEEI